MELENVIDLEVEIQESGPAGEPGPPGLSAYEIYLANGGELSETEWLESLKGEPGPPGEDGTTSVPLITIKRIAGPGTNGSSPTTWFSDTEVCEVLSKHVNDSIGNAIKPVNVVYGNNLEYYSAFHSISNTVVKSGTNNYYMTSYVTNNNDYATVMNTNGINQRALTTLFILGEWVDGVYTCTSYSIYRRTMSFIDGNYVAEKTLTKTNAIQYEPTKDYHPATKKYVDDSIAENNSGEDQLPYVIFMPGNNQYGIGMNKTITSGETFDNMQNFLNKKYEDFYVIIRYNNFNIQYGGDFAAYRCCYIDQPSLYSEGEHSERFVTAGVLADNNFGQNGNMSHVEEFVQLVVTINYTVTEDSITLTSVGIRPVRQEAWLPKNNTSSYTPTSDYHPATKKYVDDSISSIQIDKYTYLVDSNISLSSSYKGYTSNLSSSICDALTNIINDAYTKSKKKIRLIMLINNSPVTFESSIYYTTESNKTNYINILNKPTNMSYNAMAHYGHPTGTNTSSDYFTLLYNLTLVIGFDISWNENNVATVSNAKIRVPHSGQSIMSVPYINANYLSKTNTTAYTPTADYHPATKKYVDDSIAAIPVVEEPTKTFVLKRELSSAANQSFGLTDETELETLQNIVDCVMNDELFVLKIINTINNPGTRIYNVYYYKTISNYIQLIGGEVRNDYLYTLDMKVYFDTSTNKATGTVNFTTKYGRAAYLTQMCTVEQQWTYNTLPISNITPTSDKQFTTKKYVDDSIAAAITTVLEGEY